MKVKSPTKLAGICSKKRIHRKRQENQPSEEQPPVQNLEPMCTCVLGGRYPHHVSQCALEKLSPEVKEFVVSLVLDLEVLAAPVSHTVFVTLSEHSFIVYRLFVCIV